MSVRSWPYRTPADGRIVAGPWLLEAESVSELPAVLQGWDYTTDLLLRRRVDVDVPACLSDMGLPPGTPLRVCVRTRPSTSLIRSLVASQPVTVGAPVQIRSTVRGADISGQLKVETMLQLAVNVSKTSSFSPSRAGSVLWRDEVSTALEGDSGLLPVAPVSFAEAGLPSSAAWYVSLDAGRWDWAAMGSLIVLLNSDHPAVAAALTDSSTPEAVRLLETMGMDFVADLVSRALLDDGFWDIYADSSHSTDDDLSVGALVRALTRTRLCRPVESTEEAFARLKDVIERDPSMYRALVQEGLGYLRSDVR